MLACLLLALLRLCLSKILDLTETKVTLELPRWSKWRRAGISMTNIGIPQSTLRIGKAHVGLIRAVVTWDGVFFWPKLTITARNIRGLVDTFSIHHAPPKIPVGDPAEASSGSTETSGSGETPIQPAGVKFISSIIWWLACHVVAWLLDIEIAIEAIRIVLAPSKSSCYQTQNTPNAASVGRGLGGPSRLEVQLLAQVVVELQTAELFTVSSAGNRIVNFDSHHKLCKTASLRGLAISVSSVDDAAFGEAGGSFRDPSSPDSSSPDSSSPSTTNADCVLSLSELNLSLFDVDIFHMCAIRAIVHCGAIQVRLHSAVVIEVLRILNHVQLSLMEPVVAGWLIPCTPSTLANTEAASPPLYVVVLASGAVRAFINEMNWATAVCGFQHSTDLFVASDTNPIFGIVDEDGCNHLWQAADHHDMQRWLGVLICMLNGDHPLHVRERYAAFPGFAGSNGSERYRAPSTATPPIAGQQVASVPGAGSKPATNKACMFPSFQSGAFTVAKWAVTALFAPMWHASTQLHSATVPKLLANDDTSEPHNDAPSRSGRVRGQSIGAETCNSTPPTHLIPSIYQLLPRAWRHTVSLSADVRFDRTEMELLLEVPSSWLNAVPENKRHVKLARVRMDGIVVALKAHSQTSWFSCNSTVAEADSPIPFAVTAAAAMEAKVVIKSVVVHTDSLRAWGPLEKNGVSHSHLLEQVLVDTDDRDPSRGDFLRVTTFLDFTLHGQRQGTRLASVATSDFEALGLWRRECDFTMADTCWWARFRSAPGKEAAQPLKVELLSNVYVAADLLWFTRMQMWLREVSLCVTKELGRHQTASCDRSCPASACLPRQSHNAQRPVAAPAESCKPACSGLVAKFISRHIFKCGTKLHAPLVYLKQLRLVVPIHCGVSAQTGRSAPVGQGRGQSFESRRHKADASPKVPTALRTFANTVGGAAWVDDSGGWYCCLRCVEASISSLLLKSAQFSHPKSFSLATGLDQPSFRYGASVNIGSVRVGFTNAVATKYHKLIVTVTRQQTLGRSCRETPTSEDDFGANMVSLLSLRSFLLLPVDLVPVEFIHDSRSQVCAAINMPFRGDAQCQAFGVAGLDMIFFPNSLSIDVSFEDVLVACFLISTAIAQFSEPHPSAAETDSADVAVGTDQALTSVNYYASKRANGISEGTKPSSSGPTRVTWHVTVIVVKDVTLRLRTRTSDGRDGNAAHSLIRSLAHGCWNASSQTGERLAALLVDPAKKSAMEGTYFLRILNFSISLQGTTTAPSSNPTSECEGEGATFDMLICADEARLDSLEFDTVRMTKRPDHNSHGRFKFASATPVAPKLRQSCLLLQNVSFGMSNVFGQGIDLKVGYKPGLVLSLTFYRDSFVSLFAWINGIIAVFRCAHDDVREEAAESSYTRMRLDIAVESATIGIGTTDHRAKPLDVFPGERLHVPVMTPRGRVLQPLNESVVALVYFEKFAMVLEKHQVHPMVHAAIAAGLEVPLRQGGLDILIACTNLLVIDHLAEIRRIATQAHKSAKPSAPTQDNASANMQSRSHKATRTLPRFEHTCYGHVIQPICILGEGDGPSCGHKRKFTSRQPSSLELRISVAPDLCAHNLQHPPTMSTDAECDKPGSCAPNQNCDAQKDPFHYSPLIQVRLQGVQIHLSIRFILETLQLVESNIMPAFLVWGVRRSDQFAFRQRVASCILLPGLNVNISSPRRSLATGEVGTSAASAARRHTQCLGSGAHLHLEVCVFNSIVLLPKSHCSPHNVGIRIRDLACYSIQPDQHFALQRAEDQRTGFVERYVGATAKNFVKDNLDFDKACAVESSQNSISSQHGTENSVDRQRALLAEIRAYALCARCVGSALPNKAQRMPGFDSGNRPHLASTTIVRMTRARMKMCGRWRKCWLALVKSSEPTHPTFDEPCDAANSNGDNGASVDSQCKREQVGQENFPPLPGDNVLPNPSSTQRHRFFLWCHSTSAIQKRARAQCLRVGAATALRVVFADFSAMLSHRCPRVVGCHTLLVRQCDSDLELSFMFSTQPRRAAWIDVLRNAIAADCRQRKIEAMQATCVGPTDFSHLSHLSPSHQVPNSARSGLGAQRSFHRSSLRTRSIDSNLNANGLGNAQDVQSRPIAHLARPRHSRRGSSMNRHKAKGTFSTRTKRLSSAVSPQDNLSPCALSSDCRWERIKVALLLARWLHPPAASAVCGGRNGITNLRSASALQSWSLQYTILQAVGVRIARFGGMRWAPALKKQQHSQGLQSDKAKAAMGVQCNSTLPQEAASKVNGFPSLLHDMLKFQSRTVESWSADGDELQVSDDTALKLGFHEMHSPLQLLWVKFQFTPENFGRVPATTHANSPTNARTAQQWDDVRQNIGSVEVNDFAACHSHRWRSRSISLMPLCDNLSLCGTVQINSLDDVISGRATKLQDIRLFLDFGGPVCFPRHVYDIVTQLANGGNVFSEDFLVLPQPPSLPFQDDSGDYTKLSIQLAIAQADILIGKSIPFTPLRTPAALDLLHQRSSKVEQFSSRYFQKLSRARAVRESPPWSSAAIAAFNSIWRSLQLRVDHEYFSDQDAGSTSYPTQDRQSGFTQQPHSTAHGAAAERWQSVREKYRCRFTDEATLLTGEANRLDGDGEDDDNQDGLGQTAEASNVLEFQLGLRGVTMDLSLMASATSSLNLAVENLEMGKALAVGSTCYLNSVSVAMDDMSPVLTPKEILLPVVVVAHNMRRVGTVDLLFSSRFMPDGYWLPGSHVCTGSMLTPYLCYIRQFGGREQLISSGLPSLGLKWFLLPACPLATVQPEPALLQSMHILQPMNSSYSAAVRSHVEAQQKRDTRTKSKASRSGARAQSRRHLEQKQAEQAWQQQYHRERQRRAANASDASPKSVPLLSVSYRMSPNSTKLKLRASSLILWPSSEATELLDFVKPAMSVSELEELVAQTIDALGSGDSSVPHDLAFTIANSIGTPKQLNDREAELQVICHEKLLFHRQKTASGGGSETQHQANQPPAQDHRHAHSVASELKLDIRVTDVIACITTAESDWAQQRLATTVRPVSLCETITNLVSLKRSTLARLPTLEVTFAVPISRTILNVAFDATYSMSRSTVPATLAAPLVANGDSDTANTDGKEAVETSSTTAHVLLKPIWLSHSSPQVQFITLSRQPERRARHALLRRGSVFARGSGNQSSGQTTSIFPEDTSLQSEHRAETPQTRQGRWAERLWFVSKMSLRESTFSHPILSLVKKPVVLDLSSATSAQNGKQVIRSAIALSELLLELSFPDVVLLSEMGRRIIGRSSENGAKDSHQESAPASDVPPNSAALPADKNGGFVCSYSIISAPSVHVQFLHNILERRLGGMHFTNCIFEADSYTCMLADERTVRAFHTSAMASTTLAFQYVHPWLPSVNEFCLEPCGWELIRSHSKDKDFVIAMLEASDALLPNQSPSRRKSSSFTSIHGGAGDAPYPERYQFSSGGLKLPTVADQCIVVRSAEHKPVRLNFTDALRQTIDLCLSTSDKPTSGDATASSKYHITNQLDVPILMHCHNRRKILVLPGERGFFDGISQFSNLLNQDVYRLPSELYDELVLDVGSRKGRSRFYVEPLLIAPGTEFMDFVPKNRVFAPRLIHVNRTRTLRLSLMDLPITPSAQLMRGADVLSGVVARAFSLTIDVDDQHKVPSIVFEPNVRVVNQSTTPLQVSFVFRRDPASASMQRQVEICATTSNASTVVKNEFLAKGSDIQVPMFVVLGLGQMLCRPVHHADTVWGNGSVSASPSQPADTSATKNLWVHVGNLHSFEQSQSLDSLSETVFVQNLDRDTGVYLDRNQLLYQPRWCCKINAVNESQYKRLMRYHHQQPPNGQTSPRSYDSASVGAADADENSDSVEVGSISASQSEGKHLLVVAPALEVENLCPKPILYTVYSVFTHRNADSQHAQTLGHDGNEGSEFSSSGSDSDDSGSLKLGPHPARHGGVHGMKHRTIASEAVAVGVVLSGDSLRLHRMFVAGTVQIKVKVEGCWYSEPFCFAEFKHQETTHGESPPTLHEHHARPHKLHHREKTHTQILSKCALEKKNDIAEVRLSATSASREGSSDVTLNLSADRGILQLYCPVWVRNATSFSLRYRVQHSALHSGSTPLKKIERGVTVHNNDDRFFEPLDTWVVDVHDPLLVADHSWEVEIDRDCEDDDQQAEATQTGRGRLDSEASASSTTSENDDFGSAELERSRKSAPSAATNDPVPENGNLSHEFGIADSLGKPKRLSFHRLPSTHDNDTTTAQDNDTTSTQDNDTTSKQDTKRNDEFLRVGRVQVRRRKLGQSVGRQISRIPASATPRNMKYNSKSPTIGILTSNSPNPKAVNLVHARHWVPARRHWESGYLGLRIWDVDTSTVNSNAKARSSKSPVVAFAKAKSPLLAYVNGTLSRQEEAAAAVTAAATGGVLRLRMMIASSVVPMAFRSQHHCLALRNFKELASGDVDEWIFDVGHASHQQDLTQVLLHYMNKESSTQCEPMKKLPDAEVAPTKAVPSHVVGRLDVRRGLAVAKALTRWRTEQDRRAMRARMRKRLVCVSLPSNFKAEVRVLLPIRATLQSALAFLMGNNASKHYHLEMRTELHELGFFSRSNPAPNDEPLPLSTPIVDIPSSRRLYLRYRAAILDRAALALQQEVIMMPKEPFQVRACFRPEQSKETATEKEYFLRQRRLACKDQMGQVQRDLVEAGREDVAFDEEVRALKDQGLSVNHSVQHHHNKAHHNHVRTMKKRLAALESDFSKITRKWRKARRAAEIEREKFSKAQRTGDAGFERTGWSKDFVRADKFKADKVDADEGSANDTTMKVGPAGLFLVSTVELSRETFFEPKINCRYPQGTRVPQTVELGVFASPGSGKFHRTTILTFAPTCILVNHLPHAMIAIKSLRTSAPKTNIVLGLECSDATSRDRHVRAFLWPGLSSKSSGVGGNSISSGTGGNVAHLGHKTRGTKGPDQFMIRLLKPGFFDAEGAEQTALSAWSGHFDLLTTTHIQLQKCVHTSAGRLVEVDTHANGGGVSLGGPYNITVKVSRQGGVRVVEFFQADASPDLVAYRVDNLTNARALHFEQCLSDRDKRVIASTRRKVLGVDPTAPQRTGVATSVIAGRQMLDAGCRSLFAYPHPSLLPSCTMRVKLEPLGMYEPVDVSLEELTDQHTHPALRLPLEYRKTQPYAFPKDARMAMVTLRVANLPIGFGKKTITPEARLLLDAHTFRALRRVVAVSTDKPTQVFAVMHDGCMHFFDPATKDQVTAADGKGPAPLLVLDLALDSDICYCEAPKDIDGVPVSANDAQHTGEASSAEQYSRPLRPRAAVVDGTPLELLAKGGEKASSARRQRAGERISQQSYASGMQTTFANKLDDVEETTDVSNVDSGFPLLFVHSPRQVVICVEFPVEQEDDLTSSDLELLSTAELRFIDWKQHVTRYCSGLHSPVTSATSSRTRFTSSFAELRVVGDKLTRVLQVREFLFRDVERDDGLRSNFQMQLLMHIPRIEFASIELSNYAMAWSGASPAQVQASLEGNQISVFFLQHIFRDAVPHPERPIRRSQVVELFERLRCTDAFTASDTVMKLLRQDLHLRRASQVHHRKKVAVSRQSDIGHYRRSLPERPSGLSVGPLFRMRTENASLESVVDPTGGRRVYLDFRQFKQILVQFVKERRFTFRTEPREVLLLAVQQLEAAHVEARDHVFASLTIGDLILTNQQNTPHLCRTRDGQPLAVFDTQFHDRLKPRIMCQKCYGLMGAAGLDAPSPVKHTPYSPFMHACVSFTNSEHITHVNFLNVEVKHMLVNLEDLVLFRIMDFASFFGNLTAFLIGRQQFGASANHRSISEPRAEIVQNDSFDGDAEGQHQGHKTGSETDFVPLEIHRDTLDCDVWYTRVAQFTDSKDVGPVDVSSTLGDEHLVNVAAMRIGEFGFALKTIDTADLSMLRSLRPTVQAQVERAIVRGIPLVQIPSADVGFRQFSLVNCLEKASVLQQEILFFYVGRAVKQLLVNFQIIGSFAGGDMLEHAINLAQIRYRKDDRDSYLARVKRERHDPFAGTRFEFVFKHTVTSCRLSLDRARISLGDDAESLQIRGELAFAPLARIHRHQRAMFNEYVVNCTKDYIVEDIERNNEQIAERILAQFNADFLDEPSVLLIRFRQYFGPPPQHCMSVYSPTMAIAAFVLDGLLGGIFSDERIRTTYLLHHRFERAGVVSTMNLRDTNSELTIVKEDISPNAVEAANGGGGQNETPGTDDCPESRCVIVTENYVIYASVTYVLRPEPIWHCRLSEVTGVRLTADQPRDHLWVGISRPPHSRWRRHKAKNATRSDDDEAEENNIDQALSGDVNGTTPALSPSGSVMSHSDTLHRSAVYVPSAFGDYEEEFKHLLRQEFARADVDFRELLYSRESTWSGGVVVRKRQWPKKTKHYFCTVGHSCLFLFHPTWAPDGNKAASPKNKSHPSASRIVDRVYDGHMIVVPLPVDVHVTSKRSKLALEKHNRGYSLDSELLWIKIDVNKDAIIHRKRLKRLVFSAVDAKQFAALAQAVGEAIANNSTNGAPRALHRRKSSFDMEDATMTNRLRVDADILSEVTLQSLSKDLSEMTRTSD